MAVSAAASAGPYKGGPQQERSPGTGTPAGRPAERLLDLIAPGFGRLWAASVLLPLVCLIAAGWWTWANVLGAARGEMARTVDMVHEQVLRALETQDAVLAAMSAFVANMSWEQMRDDPAVHEFARRIDAATSTVQSLGLIDPSGQVVVASEIAHPPSGLWFGDRDYVRAWPAGAIGRTIFISPVVISRVDGRVQVHASLPHLGSDGRADGGVVVSSFSPVYFERFFRDAAATPATGLDLVRDDGSLLAGFPVPVTREAQRLPADALALAALRGTVPTSAGGVRGRVRFAARGSLLGGLQLVAIRPVAGYGMSIVHQLDPKVVIAEWLRQMLSPAIGAAAAMGLLLVLTARAQATTLRERREWRSRAAAAEAGEALAMERAGLEARLRQSEKVAALGQLAAGVAHDFNNLLQTVVLNAEVLHNSAQPGSPVRRSARLILTASERGIALTRRMLAHARCDAGPPPGQAGRIAVAAALRTVHDLLVGPLGAQYALRLEIEPELPPGRGDPAEFESVMINLIINARDAMPSGGVIAVSVGRRVPGPGAGLANETYLVVEVADRGHGMDTAILARAGEAFFTTKPPGRGTGLGLSMARGFAGRNGGALDLASAEGQGTTVTLWLPLAEAGRQAAAG